ncbi:MAG: outer membrane protein assembly factor BamE [Alphaproteobacteria bacterium]|nr:MAG: outer membrane protein assembly factor BamE [Alphaproteobacteria bacterium]
MKRKLYATVGISAILLATAACTPTTNIRGFIPDQKVIGAIRPGVDNQSSVRAMLGTPSVPGTFRQDRWYYVSKTSEQLAFFDPEIISQEVIAISFDDRGYVTAVDRIGLDQARDINPVDDKTPTRGRELGFWEQVFGNIGRFGGSSAPAAPGP